MATKKKTKPAPKTKPKATTSTKRTPEQFEKQESKIVSFLSKKPGSPVSAIATATGLSLTELHTPIRHLLGAKKIKREGEKRTSVYSAK